MTDDTSGSKAPGLAQAHLAAGAKVTATDQAAADKRMADTNKPYPTTRTASGPQTQGKP